MSIAGGSRRGPVDVWDGSVAVDGPLAGVRVVDLGRHLAAPLAVTLLADQGADVIRVDRPLEAAERAPLDAVLLRGRRRTALDLHDPVDRGRARDLVASADVVVEGFRPGIAERLGVGPRWAARAAPHLVYCSLPGFGADDPRAAHAAWEGVVMAAAGAYSLDVGGSIIPGGDPDAPPVFSPLPLASLFGALEGALGVVAALLARERDGRGQVVEVPLFDALFEAIGLRGLTYERGAPPYTDFGSGFYHCADGTYLTFIATWYHHLERFVDAAGLGTWRDEGLIDHDRFWSDPEALAELRRRLAAVFATRPARHWEELGRAHGCTLGMLRSTAEWREEPQALASGTFVDVVDAALGALRVPGAAVRTSRHEPRIGAPVRPPGHDTAAIVAALDAGRPVARVGPSGVADGRPPLSGVNVLDLSRVVAAPTSAKLLAQLGADVVKIDDDPARARAAVRMPAMHEHLNRGKRTAIVDLKDDRGAEAFRSLAASCDVLVHNFTIEVEERLGIDEAAVRCLAPEVVYVYLNTYGRTGPWAGHRGFAELANITTGVTERSLGDAIPETGASASMDQPRWTFTDYAAGVLGAYGAVLGLYERARTGHGQLVETSLVRATALAQLPYIVGHDGSHAVEPRGPCAAGWSSWQRLYRTVDGTVFVGAEPSGVGSLLDALGVGKSLAPGADLADVLAPALARHTTDDVCRRLRRVGVGVHPVTAVHELMAPGGVAEARGLRLEDRTDQFGAVVMPGPVIRFSRTPMRPGSVPAAFGGDGDAVLGAPDGSAGRRP
jgi:crotonobetainyl-CoA:carnitine CoA-transferase CaiB-like acyl-CoA transferase